MVECFPRERSYLQPSNPFISNRRRMMQQIQIGPKMPSRLFGAERAYTKRIMPASKDFRELGWPFSETINLRSQFIPKKLYIYL